jgi:hypothetical protein
LRDHRQVGCCRDQYAAAEASVIAAGCASGASSILRKFWFDSINRSLNDGVPFGIVFSD